MARFSVSSSAVDRLVRGALLAGGGAAVIVLGAAGGAGLLSARVVPRTIAAGIALAMIGGAEVLAAIATARRTRHRSDDHRHHEPEHHHQRPRVWPLLLPFLLLPAALLSSTGSIAGNKPFVTAGNEISNTPDAPPPPTTIEEAVDEALAPDTRLYGREEITEFTMENFAELTAIAFGDPEFVRGRRVRLAGFVYREEGWPSDDFVVGRLSIWCCLADAALVGLLARGVEVDLEDGQWVEIEGRLDVIHDYPLASGPLEVAPLVIVDTLREIEAPEMEYVLPAGF